MLTTAGAAWLIRGAKDSMICAWLSGTTRSCAAAGMVATSRTSTAKTRGVFVRRMPFILSRGSKKTRAVYGGRPVSACGRR